MNAKERAQAIFQAWLVHDSSLDAIRDRIESEILAAERAAAKRQRERDARWLNSNGQPGYACEIRALPLEVDDGS